MTITEVTVAVGILIQVTMTVVTFTVVTVAAVLVTESLVTVVTLTVMSRAIKVAIFQFDHEPGFLVYCDMLLDVGTALKPKPCSILIVQF